MRQPEMVGHVDAVFGGRAVRFELARDLPSLLKLETEIGSLRGLLGRFEAGTWLMSDVRAILARAHPVERGIFLGLTRHPAYDPITGERVHTPTAPQMGIEPSRLDPILGLAPPITYALLAARVLEAMLYGLPPERVAWDENNPGGADAEPVEAAA
jgi:hypothetical protein